MYTNGQYIGIDGVVFGKIFTDRVHISKFKKNGAIRVTGTCLGGDVLVAMVSMV